MDHSQYQWLFSAVARKFSERGFATFPHFMPGAGFSTEDFEAIPDGGFAIAWSSGNYKTNLLMSAAARRNGELRSWERIVKGALPFFDPETGEVWEKTVDLNWDHHLSDGEIPEFREKVAEQFVRMLVRDWSIDTKGQP